MPRFYFHLACKDAHIADDNGKELATLNDAYEHARTLIHKILFHVGHENAEAWKVVILNDEFARHADSRPKPKSFAVEAQQHAERGAMRAFQQTFKALGIKY